MKTIIVIIIMFSLCLYPFLYYKSQDTLEVTVRNKERVTIGSGRNIHSAYLVYTEGEVFENTDSFIFFKFDSADFQNNLEVGKTYKVKVAGWRVPFLSWFRNIVSVYHGNI